MWYISKPIFESGTGKSIIYRCSQPETNILASSRTRAAPSREAVNAALFASCTFAPCWCAQLFVAELRNRGRLLSHSGWRWSPFSHLFWFLRLLCWMSSFSSGTRSQIVLTLQERIWFAIQCIRDYSNCRAGWPFAYNSAAILPFLLL